ncbi:hypothetical protein GGP41_008636 [Bipolaris sorokiniana]|uniref:Uncharacterized protein n=1 Tax=Cochliobolus sativus TaxID=45130 RepID=A0A8H5ZCI6_COCSA|nr:hypothetical protein GGP41_008636 [Bipolaris sorokiniana]
MDSEPPHLARHLAAFDAGSSAVSGKFPKKSLVKVRKCHLIKIDYTLLFTLVVELQKCLMARINITGHLSSAQRAKDLLRMEDAAM